MESNVWEAITAIFTAVAAIGVLFAFYQLRMSKKVAVFEYIVKLDEEFNSERIIKVRARVAALDFTNLDANTIVQYENILDFFEKIAYLKEEGVISLDSIYENWGYWIERYWVLCERGVYDLRKETGDDTYYDKLEILFNKLAKYHIQKKQRTKAAIASTMVNKEIEAYKDKIKEKLKEFKEDESVLDTNRNANE
jgi:hypothetical protein